MDALNNRLDTDEERINELNAFERENIAQSSEGLKIGNTEVVDGGCSPHEHGGYSGSHLIMYKNIKSLD